MSILSNVQLPLPVNVRFLVPVPPIQFELAVEAITTAFEELLVSVNDWVPLPVPVTNRALLLKVTCPAPALTVNVPPLLRRKPFEVDDAVKSSALDWLTVTVATPVAPPTTAFMLNAFAPLVVASLPKIRVSLVVGLPAVDQFVLVLRLPSVVPVHVRVVWANVPVCVSEMTSPVPASVRKLLSLAVSVLGFISRERARLGVQERTLNALN